MGVERLSLLVGEVHHVLDTKLPRSKWIQPDLMGACAIGAFYLLDRMFEEGFRGARPVHYKSPCEFKHEHWWVFWKGWHCDPTYKQFSPMKPWLCTQEHPLWGNLAQVGARIPSYWPQEQRFDNFRSLLMYTR